MINLIQQEERSGYLVQFTGNGKFLGIFQQDVDCYFYFVPDNLTEGGYWSSWVLKAIADKLEELNKPWEDQIAQYFKDNPPINEEVLGQFDPF